MNKEQNTENKDLTATFGNTMLSAGFELKSRYSNDETSDRRGRWARLLFYNGNLISWISRIDHIDRGRFYSILTFSQHTTTITHYITNQRKKRILNK